MTPSPRAYRKWTSVRASGAALGGGRQRQFRARLLVHLQREDLAETRGAATAVQHGIAANLQLQAV